MTKVKICNMPHFKAFGMMNLQYIVAYLARVLQYWDNLFLSPPFSTRNFGTVYYYQHPQFKSPKYAPEYETRICHKTHDKGTTSKCQHKLLSF